MSFAEFCQAVREGNVEDARSKYEGVNVNQKMASWDGRSPLQYTIDNADVKMFRFLFFNCNATASFLDNKQRNALHHAVVEGQDAMFALLLEHGDMQLDDVDHWKQTALHLAAQCGNLNMAKQLVERCPEVLTFEAQDGLTASQMARAREDSSMESFLKEAEEEELKKKEKASVSPKTVPKPVDAKKESTSKRRSILSFTRSKSKRNSSSSSNSAESVAADLQTQLEQERNERRSAEDRLAAMVRERDELKAQLRQSRTAQEKLKYAAESNSDAQHKRQEADKKEGSEDSLDISALNNHAPLLLRALRRYTHASSLAEHEFEEQSRADEPFRGSSVPILDIRSRLDAGRALPQKDLSGQMKELMAPDEALASMKAALHALQQEYPSSREEVSTAVQMIDNDRVQQGVLSSTSPVPNELVSLIRKSEKLLVGTLRELYASDKSSEIADATANSAMLSTRCSELSVLLEEAKAKDDFDSIRDLEGRLRESYSLLIHSFNQALSFCSSDDARKLERGLDSVLEDARTATLRVRVVQNNAREQIKGDIGTLGVNSDIVMSELEKMEEAARREEVAAAAQEVAEAEAAQKAAAQLDELLAEELARQQRLDLLNLQRREREHRRRQINMAEQETNVCVQEARDCLEMMSKVREQTISGADQLSELMQFAVTAARKKCISRCALLDATHEDLVRQFTRNLQSYELLANSSIAQLQQAVHDVNRDISFTEEAQKRASSRGQKPLIENYAKVLGGLREEQHTLQEQLAQQRSQHKELMNKVDRITTTFNIDLEKSH